MKTHTPPQIVIVAAPSGTGKTTLTRRLVKEIPNLEFSVSNTTRSQRPGEINGIHYWFMDIATFKKQVSEGRMLEWAEVFGNLYGTTKDEIKRINDRGERALLEIDVQGAYNVRKIYPDAQAIFIMPPSLHSLWHRLSQRGTDSLEVRWRRLKTANRELEQGKNFQHFIINDDLERTYEELKNLVVYNQPTQLSYQEGIDHCQTLLNEFEKADWLLKLKENSQLNGRQLNHD